MGTTTPNIGIFIPADGEENFGTSYQQGQLYVDQHDHSGPPNGGVQITNSGIADGTITGIKLNDNVAGAALTHNVITHSLDVNVDNVSVQITADQIALKPATTTNLGGVEFATNAETKTGTSTSLVAPVATMTYHNGIVKAWCSFTVTTLNSSYGVTSITQNGTGDYTINFPSNFFANTNYIFAGSGVLNIGYANLTVAPAPGGTITTSTFQIHTVVNNTLTDLDLTFCWFIGDIP